MRSVCPGSGKPVSEPANKGWSYPMCAVCGREFSGQGKKWRLVNYWQSGAPRHYITANSATSTS